MTQLELELKIEINSQGYEIVHGQSRPFHI